MGWPDCPIGPPRLPRGMPAVGWQGRERDRTIGRMIYDIDQLLERIVKRDALNGGSVDLVFDAPTKDWVARRSGPTIDLYLYDIREDVQRRVPGWEDVRAAGGTVTDRRQPPRRFKLSYLVTAWTQRPEDEHRLLSALLACFLSNPMIKPGELGDSLDALDLPVYLEVGQPATPERSLADVWSALGGELKPSLDLVVTAPIAVGRSAPYGPPIFELPTIDISAGAATERANRAKHPAASSAAAGARAAVGAAGAATDGGGSDGGGTDSSRTDGGKSDGGGQTRQARGRRDR